MPTVKAADLHPGQISLATLKEFQLCRQEWQDVANIRIYSTEHEAYWGPNRSGYYTDWQKAGVYTFAEAFAGTSHCGPEKGITFRSEAYFQ